MMLALSTSFRPLISTPGRLLLALGLGLAACGPESNYPRCKRDKHCIFELEERCVEGRCQQCVRDDECARRQAGWLCREFRCVNPAFAEPGPGGGEIGDPCASQPDCTGGGACSAGKCVACMDDAQCSPLACHKETGECTPTADR